MLYTGNTFYFHDFTEFAFFSRQILPHRFYSIRTLSLNIFLNHGRDKRDWRRTWSVLQKMQSLSILHIRLLSLYHRDDWKHEKEMISVLKKVQCGGDFVCYPETSRLARMLDEANEGTFLVSWENVN